MFIGHFAVGMAAKPLVPRVSLGTLFLSTLFLDGLWPIFVLLGWEHVRIDPGNTRFTPLDFYDYPLSHSLVMALGWSFLFGGVYFVFRRRGAAALLLGAGVLSHWVLDFIVHRPDLPITLEGGPYVGLGLWNFPAATLAIEIPMYVLGIFLYFRATRARDGIGRYGLWPLLVLLLVIYLSGIGSPPPSVQAVALTGLAGWLLIAWAYWVDGHREPAAAAPISGETP